MGKELPTLLDIYSFCGCFIVFVCLSLWCLGRGGRAGGGGGGLDVDLIVSVPELLYTYLTNVFIALFPVLVLLTLQR